MRFQQSFNIAMRSLLADKTYFWQTMISIVVAAIALETVLIIGNGMFYMSGAAHENYISSMFYIAIQTRAESNNRIMPEDMEQLVIDNSNLFNAVSPVIPVVGDLKYNDKVLDRIEIQGVSETYNEIFQALQIEQGRFLLPMDIMRKQEVCVLGSNVAKQIQTEEILGSTVKIQGYNYKVVGIAQEIQNDFDFAGWNDIVYIPYTTAQNLKNYTFMPTYFDSGGYFDVFYLGFNGLDKKSEAYSAVYNMRKQILGKDGMIGIYSLDEWVNGLEESFLNIVIGTLIITISAGFVAGVGIANVMLLSVSRRTKEIGIRKTFGARSKDIHLQFLFEAVCVGCIGAVPGILAGIPISYVVCQNMGLIFNFSVAHILFILLLIVGFSCIFGYAPAKRAAKMEIVQAINES